ncbi:hypothetical protein FHW36_11834 [Chitinophaga polysaccharea]|uniref:Uncharacterized protein n=1 Tax=Chitinophaga polysaccharea TaxID=1293035 RepID=A0A561P0Z4_9BACT|nr:BfmA/BtgA family mobilization protein [Chitinophaga polysaccharea]TWF31740.1 hypothetical protein FHW36_11834 [Chitinophaga polysaccharea]
MAEYTTTKLEVTLKTRLDKDRGKVGLNDYIVSMVTFFDVTGAKPTDFQTHPTIQLRKDIDRVIAIQKAQEKDYKDSFKTILTEIREGKNERFSSAAQLSVPIEQSANLPATGQPIDDETLLKLGEKFEELQQQLQTERSIGSDLRREIEQLRKERQDSRINSAGGNNRTGEALELYNWLKATMKKNTFNDDYIISKSAYQAFIERIDKLLK